MQRQSHAGASRSTGLRLVLAGAAAFAVLVLWFPPSRPRTLAALLVPFLFLIALTVWWLRQPRLEPGAKAVGVGAGLVACLVLGFAPSFPANVIAVLWGVPAALGSSFAVFVGLRNGPSGSRRLAVGAVFLAALFPWSLLRVDGASGQMMPNLVWRWRAPSTAASVEALPSAAISAPLLPREAAAGDWPGLRGPARDGVVHTSVVPRLDLDWANWPPRELWRRSIGAGWSSFVVVGDLACTQDQREAEERVICLDTRSGRTLWVHKDTTRFDEIAGGPGPRATPLIDRGRVYALGATGRLNCLDGGDGRLIWSIELGGPQGETPQWGFASSPLIEGDLVYVSPAGVGGLRMLALDRDTGERIWEAKGNAAGYGSPQLAVLAGRRQILLFDGGGLVSYEPATGAVLWERPSPTDLPRAAQPHVIGMDQVVYGMGYGRGTTSLRVTPGESGWQVTEEWTSHHLKPKFNDFVVHGGSIFGLDEGILVCVDAATGERRWKAGRYGYGQIVLVGETLLVTTESGEIVLVGASPSGHVERGSIPALTGKSWSHPAVAGGRLLVRNASEAAGFDLEKRNKR